MRDIEIEIDEWFPVTLSSIIAKVKNTPYLNQLDNLNNGILHIYIKNSGGIYDGNHISKTQVGSKCDERFFYLEFSDVNVDIPFNKGIISIPSQPNPSPNPNPNPNPNPIPSPQTEKVEVDPNNKKDRWNLIIIILIITFLLTIFYLRNK